MTRFNEYYFSLPHESDEDDPIDVSLLQAFFFTPIVTELEPHLVSMGYSRSHCDILIPPDSDVVMAEMRQVFRVNIRYIKRLPDDIFLRIQFEHHDWHHLLPLQDHHKFSIYLDRFRIIDPLTQRLDDNWGERLHLRLSEMPDRLKAEEEEGSWLARNPVEFQEKLALFMRKFTEDGERILETAL